MGTLQTEHEFTLPKGLIDEHGELHRTGVMRLATQCCGKLPSESNRRCGPATLRCVMAVRSS